MQFRSQVHVVTVAEAPATHGRPSAGLRDGRGDRCALASRVRPSGVDSFVVWNTFVFGGAAVAAMGIVALAMWVRIRKHKS